MDKGKIIQTGTPAELLFKPADNFVKTFFDEQRLQLEYKSVTLQMLWPFLEDNNATSSSLKEIPSQSNVWRVLEYLNTDNKDGIRAKDNGAVKQINYASLLHAFNQYKKYN